MACERCVDGQLPRVGGAFLAVTGRRMVRPQRLRVAGGIDGRPGRRDSAWPGAVNNVPRA